MNWIDGLQNAIDYIEDNITEQLELEDIAARSFSSPYHFQRVFSILCGYTLGEYIRNRRLSLAGAELSRGRIKVIDAAVKYGYESPDSFSKAFRIFHGITPSQAKSGSFELKNFSRLSINVTLKGGNLMNYKVEEKNAASFLGVGKHFEGAPENRYSQTHDFCVDGNTRFIAYALSGISENLDDKYHIITNISDGGFDFTLAVTAPDWFMRDTTAHIGQKNSEKLKVLNVPANTYVTVKSERSVYYLRDHMDLRRRIVSEWLPSSGYELTDAPEIVFVHSDHKKHDDSYVEFWLPIKKL